MVKHPNMNLRTTVVIKVRTADFPHKCSKILFFVKMGQTYTGQFPAKHLCSRAFNKLTSRIQKLKLNKHLTWETGDWRVET